MLLLSHLCSWLGPLCHSICPEHSQYNVTAGTGQYWAGRCQWGRGRGSRCPQDSSVPRYSSRHTTDQSDSVLWRPTGSSDRPHTCQQGRSDLQLMTSRVSSNYSGFLIIAGGGSLSERFHCSLTIH